MKNAKQIFVALFFLMPGLLISNNLEITSAPVLKNIDNDLKTLDIEFSVSWENSWRNDIAGPGYDTPYNHDAIWVFVKYQLFEEEWKHATLHASDHQIPAAGEFSIPTDQKGAFVFRSENGSGSFSLDNIKLKWLFGDDGVEELQAVNVKVFAIEMVYIPEGSFYVGNDGSSARIWRNFHRIMADESTLTPYHITGEGSITLGGATDGNLGNHDNLIEAQGVADHDDFDSDNPKTLPAEFPKGYNAFYIMKYEVTQKQYADFLNTLNRQQQNRRTYTDVSGTSIANVYVMTNTSTVLGTRRNGIRVQTPVENTTDPLHFFCDLNENGIGNEEDDGLHIVCNYMGANGSVLHTDLQAYLYWAGLRPMTELEFEKTARGSSDAPWSQVAGLDIAANGENSSDLRRASGDVEDQFDPGKTTEAIINPVDANAAHRAPSGDPGPYRVGVFGKSTTNREQSGASYYGVMELSGNLVEPVYSVGKSSNRLFTSSHGSGNLDANGDPQAVANWPVQIGFKGGSFNLGHFTLRISERNRVNSITNFRTDNWQAGGRGVRTAE